MAKKRSSTFQVKSNELVAFVKEVIKEGNVRRVIIRDGKGKKYAEIPVTVGVIGFVVTPVLIGILAVAAMIEVFEVELVRQK